MKVLHCSDVGFECQAIVKANTEDEVLKIAAEHTSSVHGVNVTPDMAEQINIRLKKRSNY